MKTILITGASSGIGLALAIHYAKKHYRVIACGRNQQRLNTLAALHVNIETLVFDVTDKAAVAERCEALDSLDIVVLNAGDCLYVDDAVEFDGDLFEQVVQTNLVGCGYLLAHLTGKLAEGGQLVFVGSSVTFLPLPRAEAYGASKAGLAYLAESLAVDLYPQNIAVSLVSPGFVKTPLTAKNDFAMPFLLSADEAAIRIAKGVERRKAHIAFPKRLTWPMRLLRLLPSRWWLALSAKLVARTPDSTGEANPS